MEQERQEVQARLSQLKERYGKLSLQKPSNHRDDLMFELRSEMYWLETKLKMLGRKWMCKECGEVYGPAWVAYHGKVCDAECNGELVEVLP